LFIWRGKLQVVLLFVGAVAMVVAHNYPLAVLLAAYGGYRLYRVTSDPKGADSGALKPDFDALVGSVGEVAYSEFLPGGNMLVGAPPKDSGIAVSTKSRSIVVASNGKARAYSFDDIRSWEMTRIDGARVHIAGGGMQGAIQQGTANTVERIKAMHASGLFIRVKDVDHPVWQIHMYKQPMLDRWAEILNQTVGSLAG
jgi:hypothetical protein